MNELFNPIKNIELGDKEIRLDDIIKSINTGNLIVVVAKKGIKTNLFINRLCKKGGFLSAERKIFKYKRLKKLAQKTGQSVITTAYCKNSEAQITTEHIKNKNQVQKYADVIIALNREPYFYNAGCCHKGKAANLGWSVLGVSILESSVSSIKNQDE